MKQMRSKNKLKYNFCGISKNINSRSRFDSFTNYTPYDKNLREYGAGGAPYPDNKNLYGGDGAPYPDKNMYGGAAICFHYKFYTDETETDGIDFRSYKYRFNDYTITAYIRKRETKIKNHTGTIVAKPEEYVMILPNGDNLVLTKEQFEKLYIEL